MADIKENVILDDRTKAFGDTLIELAEKDDRVVLVSADSYVGGGGVEFRKRFPNRFYDFGICEQNAASQAAGLALGGKVPFFNSIGNFVTLRCFEQIRNDICRPQMSVILVGRAPGLNYAEQGPTHQTIGELGALRTLPFIKIIAPADALDMRNAMIEAVRVGGPAYIRMHKKIMPRINKDGYKFEIGKGIVLSEGSDVTFIACENMVHQSIIAADLLAKESVKAGVINMHTIKPIDKDLIINTSRKTILFVTAEEHTVMGGLGSAVAEILAQFCDNKLIMVGLEDVFGVDGPYEPVMDYHGLNGSKMAKQVLEFLKRGRN